MGLTCHDARSYTLLDGARTLLNPRVPGSIPGRPTVYMQVARSRPISAIATGLGHPLPRFATGVDLEASGVEGPTTVWQPS